MAVVTYHPVASVDFGDFTTAFNHAYRDYYVQIFMTTESFRALMDRDDLSLESSVVAVCDDRIVGMGLLGVRAATGWIGGLGVIPDYRRQGIGRQMMHYLLDCARDQDLAQVKLEVIEVNEKAHALYRQLGFVDMRYLHYFTRDPAPISDLSHVYQIERHNPAALLGYFTAFHPVANPWQRDYPSLSKLAPHMRGWAVLDHDRNGDHDRVLGYALGWTDHHQIRISDIATHPNSQQALVGQALLTHLHRLYPDAHSLSINVAADDPVHAAYQALGYTTHLRQIEMSLTL
ncbi:MAG: GNAT family N-acetyltransferase [Anaerolineae bacterium]|nr:GNAT family N-acetyltransferase [Anaerolineae bacterium]